MKRKLSMTEKVRRLIDQGYTNKAIIEKLRIKPQAVYNARYQINKSRGLGALGAPAPTPAEGIGAPPKRRYTRRVPAGTGINQTPNSPVLAERPATPGSFVELPITMIEPKPTLWQRIKGWFRG